MIKLTFVGVACEGCAPPPMGVACEGCAPPPSMKVLFWIIPAQTPCVNRLMEAADCAPTFASCKEQANMENISER